MSKTKIEWCDETINPLVLQQGGRHCTKIAYDCDNCYAERLNMRWGNQIPYDGRDVTYRLDCSRFRRLPKKPRRVFVQSMSDIFHPFVMAHHRNRIFYEIENLPQHIFILTTKRPTVALEYSRAEKIVFPDNLQMLFSVSTQKNHLEDAIDDFLRLPVKVRGLSLEPLLEPIDCSCYLGAAKGITWVIVGPETGALRRECKIEWIEGVVEQCRDSGTACFVKALPIDGKINRNPEDWPAHLRVREFPQTAKLPDKRCGNCKHWHGSKNPDASGIWYNNPILGNALGCLSVKTKCLPCYASPPTLFYSYDYISRCWVKSKFPNWTWNYEYCIDRYEAFSEKEAI